MPDGAQSPFYDWVPGWMQIFVAFAVLVCIMLLNGSYIGNGLNINSDMGLQTEDISLIYYSTTIGMGVIYPLIGIVRSGINSKSILLAGLSIQALLCCACASLENTALLVIAGFLIGVLKGFALVEALTILMPVFSKGRTLAEMYSKVFPINFSLGQAGIMLTAVFAQFFEWQYIYYTETFMLLVAIAFVLVCLRHVNAPWKFSLRNLDLTGAAYAAAILFAASYTMIYGRVRDWFHSEDIRLSAASIPVLAALFAMSHWRRKTPYLDFGLLRNRKVLLEHAYMGICMMLAMSSYTVSYYADAVLRYDGIYSNSLNMMLVPGFALAGIACLLWSRFRPFKFRYLAAAAMLALAGYQAMIYFRIRSDLSYEYLVFPGMLRGFAMLTVFISFSAYGMEEVPKQIRLHNAFLSITLRSVLATLAGNCLFSNLLERRAFYHLSALSERLEMSNPLAAQYMDSEISSAVAAGNGAFEAAQLAMNSAYQRVYAEAVVCAVKEIMGYAMAATLAVAAATLLINFGADFKRSRAARIAARAAESA